MGDERHALVLRPDGTVRWGGVFWRKGEEGEPVWCGDGVKEEWKATGRTLAGRKRVRGMKGMMWIHDGSGWRPMTLEELRREPGDRFRRAEQGLEELRAWMK